MHSTQSTTLEDILGPAESRYFAAGYRDVLHDIEFVEEQSHEQIHQVSSRASLRYPEGWSRNDDGSTRLPHLSSVDAVLLPLLTLQQSALGKFANNYWVEEIMLKAGSEPWWDLNTVPVEISVEQTTDRMLLSSQTGTIRSEISLRRNEDQARMSEVSRTADSVYSSVFRQVHCVTAALEYDETQLTMRASHHFSLDGNSVILPGGFDSGHWPTTTIIDYLVTMGQMVQALVYAANDTDRQHMGNLWMRTMRITRTYSPAALPLASETVTSVRRNRLLERGSARIHDMTVASVSSCGVEAEATVAYTEADSSA